MPIKNKISKHIEEVMATIFGLVAAIPQAVYWIKALEVSMHVCIHDSEIMWCSGGPGTFFPWPEEPGMLQVLTPMVGSDQLIYILIVSGLFLIIMLAITYAAILLGRSIGKHLMKKSNKSNQPNKG